MLGTWKKKMHIVNRICRCQWDPLYTRKKN